jgi:hypothetical protein
MSYGLTVSLSYRKFSEGGLACFQKRSRMVVYLYSYYGEYDRGYSSMYIHI